MAKPKQRVKPVTLANKSAGMAASAVMSFAILLSILNRQDPFQTLTLAVLSGSISGVIGYWIGIVMDSPKSSAAPNKTAKNTKNTKPGKGRKMPELAGDYTPLGSVTGEETFLDDLMENSSSQSIN